jgi:hypothetical protein
MTRSDLHPRPRALPRRSAPTPARHRSDSPRSTAHQRHPEAPRIPLRAPLCHPRGSPPRHGKTAGQRHRRPASPHRRATRIIRLRSTPNRPAYGRTFGNAPTTRADYTHKENDQERCLAAYDRFDLDPSILPFAKPRQQARKWDYQPKHGRHTTATAMRDERIRPRLVATLPKSGR